MSYKADYGLLCRIFNQNIDRIDLENGRGIIVNLPFNSSYSDKLPGPEVCGSLWRLRTILGKNLKRQKTTLDDMLTVVDSRVMENSSFRYTVFAPRWSSKKLRDVIFLLHGFNEKNWHKYFPWALRLMEATGKTVILFPIAFHMNRAPADWSNARLMKMVSRDRLNLFPKIVNTSFANAAISTRLHILPERFLWSGLQTYYDILQLIDQIKSGNHSIIDSDAGFDFFGFSIGVFLAELILMTNHNNLLNESKLFCFCGGTTFNRMSPVSKYILDSEANIALYSFFIEHLEEEMKREKKLSSFLNHSCPEGLYFRSMLDYHKMSDIREGRFTHLKDQIFALALEKDTVIPGYEVVNTLKGTRRNIRIPVRIIDFPYNYSHVNPFPLSVEDSQINKSFDRVFHTAARFLG